MEIQQFQNRVSEYIKSHPHEVRFLCFFAALALVWVQADNIESFIRGFFDGLYDAGHQ
ncbi:hypothetical protein INQ41_05380 [Lysobacter ciconiae]|uniref:Uncharacterized protein n=1 Tax=Novilysobacter ciconiae TaxID=2781022 RepID=A0A7S6ZT89_9GAMM|nr:hypothetical protein [Lysobacter ciconiae]QOW20449.1 hypothetical protein INQ41_05380 [Lysobacter ciconiae]